MQRMPRPWKQSERNKETKISECMRHENGPDIIMKKKKIME